MLIVKVGQLVDGTGAPPVRDVALAIDNGRIRSIVPVTTVQEAEREVIDLSTCTLLPGFIDAHVHLMFEPGPDHATTRNMVVQDSDEILLLRAARNAQLALLAGVTTLRDCGGRGLATLALRDAVASGLVTGPRILAAGQPITTTAGHLHYLGLEADTADELVKAGRRMVKAGADFIKVCATGGNMTAGSNPRAAQYGAAELSALVADAHRLGVSVAAHAQGTPGIRNAVEAGVDFLEHCTWVGESGGVDYDQQIVEQIIAKGIHAVFTFAGVQRELLPGDDEGDTERSRKSEELQEAVAIHRRMLGDGVPAILASDAGVRLTRFEDFALSVEVMVRGCGTEPMQAIMAATRAPAEALGLSGQIGTVGVGKVADLVAVDGDPLADVRVLRRVRAVLRNGRAVVWQGRLLPSRHLS